MKRKVAVKLIKAGMDSRAVLARFDAERQALAVMDHPNIAKVLDGGLHDGRPYFVMELVKGTPITEYCDKHRLTLQERLQLFVPVCQAIQHAHQKGVIHRDIKPSNVMVALYDDRPIPKVIDFGVAKATGQTLTELTLHTGFGSVVGTPEYMSPEQASFNNLDIDTRSDVYSLGVLLYELLTGTTPVDRGSLKEAAVLEVLRIVREVEAPRPSLKLSTTEALPSLAASRGTEPTKLPSMMRGELDWIVLKALEKDRGRRYESANGLAADVTRYLSGEAVAACPPTLGYRLRKTYRRNRAAVLVGLTIAMLLVVGGISATVLAMKAQRAEELAETKRIEAEQNRDAWLELSEVYRKNAVDAEIRNVSARLDADLLEYKADARVGVLRLSRALSHTFGPIPTPGPNFESTDSGSFLSNSEFKKLREFQAAAVIAAGQEFVPLIAPIDFNYDPTNLMDYSSAPPETSPDGRLYLSQHSSEKGLKLITLPVATTIGYLQENEERVLQFGFSPDSQTIWTQDVDSVVRFWNTDGTFRAKTPLRPERFVYPAGLTSAQARLVANRGNELLVADNIALLISRSPRSGKNGKDSSDWDGTTKTPGTAELYSMRTGLFIRRLSEASSTLYSFSLQASGRWLIYLEQRDKERELVVVSTADGNELARLSLPGDKFLQVSISPNGKRLLTIRHSGANKENYSDNYEVKLWKESDGKIVEDNESQQLNSLCEVSIFLRFVTDDVIDFGANATDSVHYGVAHISSSESRVPGAPIGAGPPDWNSIVSELDGTLIRCGRVLTDASSLQRLNPPLGRKYAPELVKLAPDGRFWESLDTVTEKDLPYHCSGRYFPSLGQVGVRYFWEGNSDARYGDDTELRIMPDAKLLEIPPLMLELWTQIVVGGELSLDGRFQPWDQSTWEAKQRELAAMQPPYEDFPFPGWAAKEPNLWYRIRACQLFAGSERDRLINEWRMRTGRILPKREPDLWRTPGAVQTTDESQPNTSGDSPVSDAPNKQP